MHFINMLMIIFYALRPGLATGSECFVIGLTQYLHINNLLVLINELTVFQEEAGTFQVQKPVVHGRINANY